LISYSASNSDTYRRAATYVDRILEEKKTVSSGGAKSNDKPRISTSTHKLNDEDLSNVTGGTVSGGRKVDADGVHFLGCCSGKHFDKITLG
jgi:hypothetical protein